MLAERGNVMVMGVSLEDLFKEAVTIVLYGMTGSNGAELNGGNEENER